MYLLILTNEVVFIFQCLAEMVQVSLFFKCESKVEVLSLSKNFVFSKSSSLESF